MHVVISGRDLYTHFSRSPYGRVLLMFILSLLLLPLLLLLLFNISISLCLEFKMDTFLSSHRYSYCFSNGSIFLFLPFNVIGCRIFEQ